MCLIENSFRIFLCEKKHIRVEGSSWRRQKDYEEEFFLHYSIWKYESSKYKQRD